MTHTDAIELDVIRRVYVMLESFIGHVRRTLS